MRLALRASKEQTGMAVAPLRQEGFSLIKGKGRL